MWQNKLECLYLAAKACLDESLTLFVSVGCDEEQKRLIRLTQGMNLIKLFISSLITRTIKLECFAPDKPLEPSLIFASKAT